MKTFDIACEYLKGMDFTGFDWETGTTTQEFQDRVEGAHIRYMRDPANTLSNDYYRSIVFNCAGFHTYEIEHKENSFWNAACGIIKQYRDVVEKRNFFGLKKSFEKWKGTVYPKVMADAFIEYCHQHAQGVSYLSDTSEIRMEFFFTAYHYVLDKVA